MSDTRRGARMSRRRFAGALALLGSAALLPAGSTAGRRVVASSTLPARRPDDRIRFALQDTHLDRIQPLLDAYAAETGVAVEAVALPHGDLYQDLTVNLMLETCAYDVVSLDDPWMPLFGGSGFLTDLERLAEREEVAFDLPDFVPSFLELGRTAELPGLRGIPWHGNFQFFAWRADVLATLGLAPPATWDDVVAVAEAVSAAKLAADLHGFGLRGIGGNPAATTFLPLLRGYGGDVLGPGWEPQLGSDGAAAAMATLLRLARLAPTGLQGVGQVELGQQLAAGQIAMAADIWPNQLLKANDPALSTVVGRVAIGPQPAQAGVSPATMTGNWLLGIPEGCSQNARAALAFTLWLTAPAQQLRLLLEAELPATRVSVMEDPEAVARLPFLPDLLGAARIATPRPRTIHYPAIELILGTWVAEALTGRISGTEALASADRDIHDLLVRESVLDG